MSIDVKSDILQDPDEVGKNYVGSSLSAPLSYAFILISGSDINAASLQTGEQVVLKLAPETISIDEPKLTTITLTQNAGKYIDRQGCSCKTIALSGTTAYNANPKLPQQLRQLLPQSSIVEQEGPLSGQAEFIKLRNLFRKYDEVFNNVNNLALRNQTFMIFVNQKDNESFIVEPLSFRMTRQSPRNKFTYQYDIMLQTVAPVTQAIKLQDSVTLFQRVQNIKAEIQNIAGTVGQYAAALGNFEASVAGAMLDATSIVTSVCLNISTGLANIASGNLAIVGLKDAIVGNADSVAASFQSSWQRLLDVRDTTTATTGSDPIPLSIDNALTQIAANIAIAGARQEFFAKSFSDTYNDALSDYDPSYGIGGQNDALTAPVQKQGLTETVILPDETIFDIAVRTTGDAESFFEIVTINGLKPPFISSSQSARLPNTLAPGDNIFIPATSIATGPSSPVQTNVFADPVYQGEVVQATGSQVQVNLLGANTFRTNQWQGFTLSVVDGAASGASYTIVSNTTDTLTLNKPLAIVPAANDGIKISLTRVSMVGVTQKSAFEQSLGADVRLTPSKDFAVNSAGQLDIVQGFDNFNQAMQIRFNVHPGQLPGHPNYGSAVYPGQKVSKDALFILETAHRQSLLQDNRVAGVDQLNISASQDVVTINARVLVGNQLQSLSFSTQGV